MLNNADIILPFFINDHIWLQIYEKKGNNENLYPFLIVFVKWIICP